MFPENEIKTESPVESFGQPERSYATGDFRLFDRCGK
jgi:hypothetical protein